MNLNVNGGLWSLRWSSWVVCYFSERYTIWSWGECAETSTLGRIGVWFECLPLVNNLPHYGMMDFKWFGNYSSPIDGSNNGFSKIFADVLPPWHCVNTLLKTARTSAFIEVRTLVKGLTAAYTIHSYVNSKGVLSSSPMAFLFWLYFN